MQFQILTLLNVLIVIAGIFFFQSIVVSHVLEFFAGFFNSRGKMLENGLKAVFAAKVSDEFFENALMKSFKMGGMPPAYIEPKFFAQAVTSTFADVGSAASKDPLLKSLYEDAVRDGVALENKIEDWFEAWNKRLLGRYVRYTTFYLVLIGFVLAIAVDIDVIHLIKSLWAHPDATSTFVDQIQKISGQAQTMSDQEITTQFKNLAKSVSSGPDDGKALFAWQNLPVTIGDWFQKVLGWAIAAVAASLGSQFWFRVLSEGLKLRATGVKPADGTDITNSDEDKDDGDEPAASQGAAAPPATPAAVLDQRADLSPGLTLASFSTASNVADDGLGGLSSKYEVGGRGPGTVSSGFDDPGGISYGSYQMSSKPNGGTVTKFAAGKSEFDGLTPATPAFSAKWKELAKTEPNAFFEQQHAFIKATHYEPVVKELLAKNIDIEQRSNALRNVVWSTAVQHNRNAIDIIETAHGRATQVGRPDAAVERAFIQAIYAERGRRDQNGVLVHFKSSPRSTQESVAKRFIAEAKDALAMFDAEMTPRTFSV